MVRLVGYHTVIRSETVELTRIVLTDRVSTKIAGYTVTMDILTQPTTMMTELIRLANLTHYEQKVGTVAVATIIVVGLKTATHSHYCGEHSVDVKKRRMKPLRTTLLIKTP